MDLTPRQRDFLRLRCTRGLTEWQIADECFVTHHTVRNTLTQAYRRLRIIGRNKEAIACCLLCCEEGCLDEKTTNRVAA